MKWTTREQDILQELMKGKTSREIARTLHLRVPTVNQYISIMRYKARAMNRLALVLVYVTQHGLPAR